MIQGQEIVHEFHKQSSYTRVPAVPLQTLSVSNKQIELVEFNVPLDTSKNMWQIICDRIAKTLHRIGTEMCSLL